MKIEALFLRKTSYSSIYKSYYQIHQLQQKLRVTAGSINAHRGAQERYKPD